VLFFLETLTLYLIWWVILIKHSDSKIEIIEKATSFITSSKNKLEEGDKFGEEVVATSQALMSMELYSKDATLLTQLIGSASIVHDIQLRTGLLDTIDVIFQEFGIYAGYVMGINDTIAIEFTSLVDEKVLIPTAQLRKVIADLYESSGDKKLLTSLSILDGIRAQVEQKLLGKNTDEFYVCKTKQDLN